MIRTYSDLIKLKTFEERFEYLKLNGIVGEETFGSDRYLNQQFYRSARWKRIRDKVIIRDNGCDLGIEGQDIYGRIIVHHMNPITSQDILNQSEFLLNPEYLICMSYMTHEAVTYGDENLLMNNPVVRMKNDTCPWRN